MMDIVKSPKADIFKTTPGYPSQERLAKGPVAVIECEQEIPCNPCETGCPHNAIVVGSPITNLPAIVEDACVGCGLCIAGCPGQAIFLVDMSYTENSALVAFPYEFVPMPQPDDTVHGVDRNGETLCEGTVRKIVNNKIGDRTCVIYVEIDKRFGEEVRSIVRL